MRVLGRDLPAYFEKYWLTISADVDVPVEYIEEGHSAIFGTKGYDKTAPDLPDWADLPDDDLAYHIAHELTHMVQRSRGYPKTVRGRPYPPDSAEARIGGDLEELILHPPLEQTLREAGFRWDFIKGRLMASALDGISSSPPPEYGTPWFFTWAIRYCELQMELSADQWAQLNAAFKTSSPGVVELGEEMVTIIREVGWGTRLQALDSLVKVRDSLGLKINEVVLVLDPTTGNIL